MSIFLCRYRSWFSKEQFALEAQEDQHQKQLDEKHQQPILEQGLRRHQHQRPPVTTWTDIRSVSRRTLPDQVVNLWKIKN